MILWLRIAVLLTVLVFLPRLLEQFEPPKAAVVRTIGCGLLAALLVRLPRRKVAWRPLDFAVLAWLGIEVLATAFSRSPRLSVFGEPEQREGLITSLGLAGLYLAARFELRAPARVRAVLDALYLAVSVSSAYALLQALHLDPLPWTRYATYGEGAVRPFGTLGHPNLLGVVTAATGIAALCSASLGTERRKLDFATALLCGLATLVTLSRGAWLAYAVGCLVALPLVLRARRGTPFSPKSMWAAGAVVAVALVLIALSPWGRLLGARFVELLSPASGSSRSRLEIWRAALAAWQARPILGQGPDAFGLVYSQYQTPAYWLYEWGGLPGHAHSIALHALATRGVLGAAAGLAWAVGVALAGARAWRAGGETRSDVALLLAGLATIVAAGMFGALGITGAVLVVVFSGALAGLTEETAPQLHAPAPALRPKPKSARAARRERERERPRGAGWLAKPIGIATAATLLGLSITELLASHAGREARDTFALAGNQTDPIRQNLWTLSAQQAQRAARWAPFDDGPLRQAADAIVALAPGSMQTHDLLRAADQYARQAVVLEPLRAINDMSLGNVLTVRAARGESALAAAAESVFAHGARLAPVDAVLLMGWARAEIQLGRPRRALEPLARVTALYPREAMAYALRAAAYVAMNDRAGARAALEQAAAGEWHGNDAEKRRTDELVHALASVPDSTHTPRGATP